MKRNLIFVVFLILTLPSFAQEFKDFKLGDLPTYNKYLDREDGVRIFISDQTYKEISNEVETLPSYFFLKAEQDKTLPMDYLDFNLLEYGKPIEGVVYTFKENNRTPKVIDLSKEEKGEAFIKAVGDVFLSFRGAQKMELEVLDDQGKLHKHTLEKKDLDNALHLATFWEQYLRSSLEPKLKMSKPYSYEINSSR